MAERSGLSPLELAAAQSILASVNGLRDALHQLEYLQGLPLLIQQAEDTKRDRDSEVQVVEQRLASTTAQLDQVNTRVNQAQAEVSRLEEEIRKLQAFLAMEQERVHQLTLAKEVLKDELRQDLSH
jgi:peptidoglycan hydrolase CwlO-like protein